MPYRTISEIHFGSDGFGVAYAASPGSKYLEVAVVHDLWFATVNFIGEERFKELVDQVAKNRKDNAEAIKVVEDRVLKLVRKQNKRDKIDEKRAAKGKKKKAPVVEEEPDVDEEDFVNWN